MRLYVRLCLHLYRCFIHMVTVT